MSLVHITLLPLTPIHLFFKVLEGLGSGRLFLFLGRLRCGRDLDLNTNKTQDTASVRGNCEILARS
jgi:hypothetical protein